MTDTIHTIAVTALIEFQRRFLFIERPPHEGEFTGQWVFPGGRVHSDEDVVQALLRELREEVGLSEFSSLHFLTAYKFKRKSGGSTQGLVFLARARTNNISVDQASASSYRWISASEVVDFLEADKTIYGMEVHVRNALLVLRGLPIPAAAASVTAYQNAGCEMTREYLAQMESEDWDYRQLESEAWIFPNPGRRKGKL